MRKCSAAVGVVLYVDGVVHGGGGGVGFFVGGDVGLMLHCRADVVDGLQQDFLAGGGNFEFEDEAVFVGDGLVRQIDGQRIALFFFGALEDLVHLIFGECCGQDAVLEAIVVENVCVARRDDEAEAVVFHAPGGVLATGAAAEIGARQQNRCAFVARKIQDEFRIWFFAGEIAPVVKENAAEAFER